MRIRRCDTPVPSTRYPTRVGTPPDVKTITFETAMGLSRSAIPPLIWRDGLGRVCRLIIDTPSTRTVPFLRLTSRTRPVLPLSFPVMIFTSSSFFSLILFGGGATSFLPMLDDLRRQGDDLH